MCVCVVGGRERERETERQRDRETERDRDRETVINNKVQTLKRYYVKKDVF